MKGKNWNILAVVLVAKLDDRWLGVDESNSVKWFVVKLFDSFKLFVEVVAMRLIIDVETFIVLTIELISSAYEMFNRVGITN